MLKERIEGKMLGYPVAVTLLMVVGTLLLAATIWLMVASVDWDGGDDYELKERQGIVVGKRIEDVDPKGQVGPNEWILYVDTGYRVLKLEVNETTYDQVEVGDVYVWIEKVYRPKSSIGNLTRGV